MSSKNDSSLKKSIKTKAKELGFDLVGICKAEYSPENHNYLLEWLSKGYHGDMDYMSRKPRLRSDPSLFLEGARSVVSVAMSYYKKPGYHKDKPYISIYARGKPYQKVLKDRLKALLEYIKTIKPDVKGKIAVDTSPTFDKLWAEKAGLGWRGKNTLLINKNLGSFLFLGELFLNIEIEPDEPVKNLCAAPDSRLADCRKCLDSCPTGALEQPNQLNASKCISYLTIETKSRLENPELIGNHILGCDICQLVCPFNKNIPATKTSEFMQSEHFYERPIKNGHNLTESEFYHKYSGTIIDEYGFYRYVNNMRMVKRNINTFKS
ncbi:MAG: tRNA epoxyqueuosine(34) reductase QueG [candidate division Zixibacteria bacterium]|nr:tRNA epoxyqueuosine(34) reductase QueG [candidate division Zixibacteria bacterium]